MLNLPGHHSTASIVAEVTRRGEGRYDTDAFIQISDCDRKIMLDFQPLDPDEHANDLYKIDTLLDTLRTFKRGLVKAHRRAVE